MTISGANDTVAIVTPSFARDIELCRSLNESVLRFLPDAFRHYIFVPRLDMKLFRPLESARTSVIPIEDILPEGFTCLGRPPAILRRLPFATWTSKERWLFKGERIPISGWLIQQIVKIAAAEYLTEPTLVLTDSDIAFIRPIKSTLFVADGRTRLYRLPKGLRASATLGVEWHRNGCRLLGLAQEDPPMDNYVGPLISWNREIVRGMCARIEEVTKLKWYHALVRTRGVSEFLLYGLYADRILRDEARTSADESNHCLTYWSVEPLPEWAIELFVSALTPDHVALMFNALSTTSVTVRQKTLTSAIRHARSADAAD
jgi:hypothetical protein